MNAQAPILTLAILGGTGKEGKGLVYRWARAGYRVLIGSRTPEKARTTAEEIIRAVGDWVDIRGVDHAEAVRQADVVVLTVPYSAHQATLESIRADIQGKLLIDVTVPLVPPAVAKVQMPDAGSAAQEACRILGEGVRVCTAFQNISYEQLIDDQAPECDILVTGTSQEARNQTLALVRAAGLVGWDAGPIENSVVVEGLTSVLIHINKQYKSKRSGIKVTGVPAATPS